ncbi:porin family protein [Octadecabacter sp. G9-8]|uniref:Porin family protein n=1 Tax=Octadecabacter dasysiphoniae TaxID=2909341 RepID=A0ABS9CVA8_9RHOB|nr:porin [Octadecabacter dasysiphoniae]MCF2871093.1 porin family protein [Octadecabacter dasysiphoniae]
MFNKSLMSAVFAVIAAPVIAGNTAEPAPTPTILPPMVTPASTATDWSGFYVGAQFGQGEVSASDADGSVDFDTLGLHAGYNYDLGSYVIGGEISFDDISADGGGEGDTTHLELRGGYDFGRVMAYGVIGVVTVDDAGDRENGSTLGLGVNYLVTDHVVLGAEYLRDTYDFDGADVDLDTLSLRTSYKF